MDSEAIDKINLLTNGDCAKDFFAKNGLDDEDINEIIRILTNKVNNKNMDMKNIEREMQSTVTEYCLEKNIISKKEKLSKNMKEKKLIFKLNNDLKGFLCRKCNQPVLVEFNYCPKCGNKVEIRNYRIIHAKSIDLDKGFVTPNELALMRFVTPEELDLINNGEVNPQEIGLPVTENNCPLEVRYDFIYNDNFKMNKDLREKIFYEQREFYNEQKNNFELSTFNPKIRLFDKKFPLNFRLNQKNIVKEEKLLKREFLPSHKSEKRAKIPHIKTTPVEVNLEYAGVLYLLDVLKHPKSPKLSDNILSTLNVSSNKKIINYLRKNHLMINAEGLNLVKINLQQKKVTELKKVLSNNKLQVSGSKDELINRIIENLSEEELSKYAKGKALLVTREGIIFLKYHPHVETYLYYLKDYPITEYEKYYQENKNMNGKDLVITFLENVRFNFAKQFQWHKFSTTYLSENRIYRDIGDRLMELETTISIFICSLNPWIDNAVSLQYSSVINQNLQNEIIKLKTEIDEKTVHEIFINKTKEIKLPGLFLEAEEMFNIFNKITEDNLEEINKEIDSKFDTSQLKPKDTKYKSEQEQRLVYEKVKGCFK